MLSVAVIFIGHIRVMHVERTRAYENRIYLYILFAICTSDNGRYVYIDYLLTYYTHTAATYNGIGYPSEPEKIAKTICTCVLYKSTIGIEQGR